VTTGPLPASRKIHVAGSLHPDIRVPMREIVTHPTAGEAPLPDYDSSGPHTDPEVIIEVGRGLPALRRAWIMARGDVEGYQGRHVRPEDNGFVTGDRLVPEFPVRVPPLRGIGNAAPTQMAYARAGIITPEMEFVTIRENQLREAGEAPRDGNDWGASIPDHVTPEFVRSEIAAGHAPAPSPMPTTRRNSRNWRHWGNSRKSRGTRIVR
jgi:phosphomethylpyrimidine synthase